MSKQPKEWADDIDGAIKASNRNLGRASQVAAGSHQVTAKGTVVWYDINWPICNKEATKVTTTTIYHKPNTHEEKIKDLERAQQLEDFKYNVAKNVAAIEKKVTRAQDENNDEFIRLNRRVDQLHLTNSTPKYDDPRIEKLDKRMIDMDQRHNDAIDDMMMENNKLRAQIDALTKTINAIISDRDNDAFSEGIELYQYILSL